MRLLKRSKHLIKAVLPRRVLNKAKGTKDWLRIRTLPKQTFDSDNLRGVGTLPPLADILRNEEISSAWEVDHNAIRHVYGDDERMGGVNPGDRRALYYLVMALNPHNVLEVGTHIGASTLHIARALKRLNQNGRMTSVDIADVNDPTRGPWKELGLPMSPREFTRQLECADTIDFHTGPSLDFMRMTIQRFDLVFLDGDHSARAVYQEVSAALSILKSSATILLHDYYPEPKSLYPKDATILGPFYALQRVRKENARIDVLPLGDLPWPTKHGKHVTTLALVVQAKESPVFPRVCERN